MALLFASACRGLSVLRRPSLVVVACLLHALASAQVCHAERESEVAVKVALLFNMVRYVEWPGDAFEAVDSPLVLGVLGDEYFFEVARAQVQGKSIGGRTIEIRSLEHVSKDGGERLHVLFVGRSHGDREEETHRVLGKTPVFVISDSEGYANLGGTAHFCMQEEKVRFAINPSAAREQRLKISSKLLRLAMIVER